MTDSISTTNQTMVIKGNIVDDDDRMFIFVDELGKHFGPKSGTGKLLIIDGEPQSIKNRPDVGPYFDYFIIQAYKPGNDNNLDKRLIDGGVAGRDSFRLTVA